MSPLGAQTSRNVSTPHNGLPSIHQRRNTVKEPSVHTLDEDEYFGGSPLKKHNQKLKENTLFAPIATAKKKADEEKPDQTNMNAQEVSNA